MTEFRRPFERDRESILISADGRSSVPISNPGRAGKGIVAACLPGSMVTVRLEEAHAISKYMVQGYEVLEIRLLAGLESFFDGKSPKLWGLGEPAILERKLLGIISARQIDSDLALKSSQLLKQLASLKEVSFVSGWHSPLEEEALNILLAQGAAIVYCVPKSLYRFVPSAGVKDRVSQGKALLLTHCSPGAKRISRDTSLRRNELVVVLAAALLVLSAPQGSASLKVAKSALRYGKPVMTPEHRLFRDVSGYSFANYERELKADIDLEALRELTERFLQHHHRQVQKKDGLVEFLTPEDLRGPGIDERFTKVTFDRKAAIESPDLTFFALGHPFVDSMLKACGDVSFGGYCTRRYVKNPKVSPRYGYTFNFIVRQRIHRDDHEEFLFALHPIFIGDDGTIDDITAKTCLESYSDSLNRDIQIHLGSDDAFEIAKGRLQKQVKTIWDWEEDVTLLNLALVAVGS